MGSALQRPSSRRHEWMDLLRGLSILLVVLFHVSVTATEHFDIPAWSEWVNGAAAPLRMPTMMFLSGLLVSRSLAKGPRSYINGKIRMIAWPYLVWSVIMTVLMVGAAGLTGSGRTWAIILEAAYDPIGHLWFLYFIFCYYLIGLAARSVNGWIPILLMVVLSAAGSATQMAPVLEFGFLGAFFFGGVLLSSNKQATNPAAWPSWVKLLGGVALVAALGFGLAVENARFVTVMIPVVALGILGAILVANTVAASAWLAPIRYVGRESLPYYLIHYPAAMVLVPVFASVTANPTVAILGSTVVALAVATAAAQSSNRWSWAKIFFVWPVRPSGKHVRPLESQKSSGLSA